MRLAKNWVVPFKMKFPAVAKVGRRNQREKESLGMPSDRKGGEGRDVQTLTSSKKREKKCHKKGSTMNFARGLGGGGVKDKGVSTYSRGKSTLTPATESRSEQTIA